MAHDTSSSPRTTGKVTRQVRPSSPEDDPELQLGHPVAVLRRDYKKAGLLFSVPSAAVTVGDMIRVMVLRQLCRQVTEYHIFTYLF